MNGSFMAGRKTRLGRRPDRQSGVREREEAAVFSARKERRY